MSDTDGPSTWRAPPDVGLLGEVAQEVVDQQRNVLAALAQRRHDDVNHVEAEEQILAEEALRDQLPEIPVGGRDDAHVGGVSHLLGADLLELPGLEESQQQPLHARRHLPDLVEEDGAVARHLELAGLVAVRTGEAALHVPEQLRLEQVLRQPGAVDRHERRRRPQRLLADGAGHHFLARSALAGDEHLGVRAGHPHELGAKVAHDGAGPDQLRRGFEPSLVCRHSLRIHAVATTRPGPAAARPYHVTH